MKHLITKSIFALSLLLPTTAASAAEGELAASLQRGQGLYMQTCMACHQMNGKGVPGAFPPLAGMDYVTGDARRLIAIVLKGINPPMTINGMTYAVPMIAPVVQFPAQLGKDEAIADVLNYVRHSFENKPNPDVLITPALVAEVKAEFASRTTPWTEAELKEFPAKK
jgi:mono/diheme cytochrome c family protein